MDNSNKIAKAREFCEKVRILAREYDLPFFIVTDGASSTHNNGCEAIRVARENHTKWEKKHGFDPEEDWSNDKFDYIDFPKNEYKDYKKRLSENKTIYTTRVSNEVGKYKKEKIYNSSFGKLKVIYFKHFENINEHPFYNELKEQQINEINLYISEKGYDLIGLIKI